MPWIVPLLPALIGAGTAATTTGLQLSGALTPDQPKPTAPVAPAGPTKDQIVSAAGPQALSIESATGGSVSPDYLSTIAPLLSGTAGGSSTSAAMQQILQQIFGKGGGQPTPPTGAGTGATPGFSPSGLPVNLGPLAATPGVSDFLSKIAGGIS